MRGCDKRFDTAYREFSPRIYRFVRSKVWCSETAADLMQDTFIRFQQADKKSQVEDIGAYLFRIARNLIVDYIRSVNSKYAPKELVEFGQIPDLAEDGLGLEDMFAIRSRINKTCEVVSALSASCQRIFWLSRLYGYKNSEIAEQEGVCLSTVEKNISRALKHCRTEAVLLAA